MQGIEISADRSVPSWISRIKGLYPGLRDSEKKVADYVLKNRDGVIHLSITEVAEAAGASESTVVRLCKALEYRGFQDLKIHLARECGNPTSQLHESINRNDDPLTIKKKVFDSEITAITETLKVLDDTSFLRAVNLLSEAGIVEFYGTGGSGSVAEDARHKFLKIGKKCFAYSDSDLQSMSACLLGEGDVAVGISHSGGNVSVIDALKLARKSGASVIAITNYGKSPITKISDIVLFTASRETAFKSDALSSRIAELVILDALWAAAAFRNYDLSYANTVKTREATASKKF